MMRAAAYNKPNRPGTHPPRKIAPNRPSFLIHCPELDTDLTCTKQTPDHISNRQFFEFLKLPDTLVPGPLRAPLASRKAVRARKAASSLPARAGRRTPKQRGEQALSCGTGEVLFLLEQRGFAFEAPAVAG